MKYGVPVYKYELLSAFGDTSYNIGDYIQSFAIYQFYQSIGICEKDIIIISIEELHDYSGPYMIIIFNMYGGFLRAQLSDRIIPVFWGFNYAGYIDASMFSTLKKHEPIGCRDAETLKNLRSRGLNAFLSGCITMTLSARAESRDLERYFFVDTPSELNAHIPTDIQRNAEYISHIIPAEIPLNNFEARETLKKAELLLDRYKKEAVVVVTSRLHCASPCIAMGIPVIIVKMNRDVNMSWIERFISINTPDNFSNIDWHPTATNNESLKEMMRKSAGTALKVAANATHLDLSYELEKSVSDNFNTVLYNKLNEIIKLIGKKAFSFVIWGLGDGGGIAYRIINEVCPEAACIAAIDGIKEGDFYGLNIQKPDILYQIKKDFDFVFVTTYTGRNEAINFLDHMGLKKGADYAFLLSRVGDSELLMI